MQSAGNEWHSLSIGHIELEICHGITLSFKISIVCSWRKLFASPTSVTLSSFGIVSHDSCRQASSVWLFVLELLNSSVVFIGIEHNSKHNNSSCSLLTFFDIFPLYTMLFLTQWRQYYIIQIKSLLRVIRQNNSFRTNSI
jgi:hypothetical protein